jgi:hypothetical protein
VTKRKERESSIPVPPILVRSWEQISEVVVPLFQAGDSLALNLSLPCASTAPSDMPGLQ